MKRELKTEAEGGVTRTEAEPGPLEVPFPVVVPPEALRNGVLRRTAPPSPVRPRRRDGVGPASSLTPRAARGAEWGRMSTREEAC